jgi:hypothetical protein
MTGQSASQISLIEALRLDLLHQWPQGGPWSHASLQPLSAKGLAHDHVRLGATRWLARIPKQSQMQLAAVDNLRYQQVCFDRASETGHSPRCLHVLEPSACLPRGALIVEEVTGRAAALPGDLGAIAECMAAIHRLPLIERSTAAPLLYADDPVQAMLQEIQVQASYIPQASLDGAVLQCIQAELRALEALCANAERPLRRLIAFDGHPGNFVISTSTSGKLKAWLVDLEKCRYSYPGFDLAHASLYTSTTWDVDVYAELSVDQVFGFYEAWAQAVDTQLADASLAWHLPLRRAMWLWSLTWCAKWRVASRVAASQQASGEDWSAENLDAGLVAHVRDRVDHYLSPACVASVVEEFDALAVRFESLRR